MPEAITVTKLQDTAIKLRNELLLMPIIGAMRTLKHFTPRGGIQYREMVASLLTTGNLLVPYDGNDNAVALGSLEKRILEVNVGSAVIDFEPETWRSVFLGDALVGATQAGANPVPQEQAILTGIMRQISGDLNKAIFGGVKNVAVKTTASVFNGIDTIIDAEKALGTPTISVALGNMKANGTWDASGAVDLLKVVYNAASDELQDEPVKMFVSKNFYNNYLDDYKAVTGATPYNKEYKKTFLEGSDDLCELVPLVSKKGSRRVMLTTQSNVLYGFDQMSDMETVKVREASAFKLQFVVKMAFGMQLESLHNSRLMIQDFPTV